MSVQLCVLRVQDHGCASYSDSLIAALHRVVVEPAVRREQENSFHNATDDGKLFTWKNINKEA